MFFLTKRVDVEQCLLGDEVMVLADFFQVPAGTKGFIYSIYDRGVMVEWHGEFDGSSWICPRRDGFGNAELQYLIFGTVKHPAIDPEVAKHVE